MIACRLVGSAPAAAAFSWPAGRRGHSGAAKGACWARDKPPGERAEAKRNQCSALVATQYDSLSRRLLEAAAAAAAWRRALF